jgi:catechol 2,3-dioxygenase-like lactoylglutathione lyase family enzyme
MAVALQRMDNVGIVVESLDATISFFAELGLELVAFERRLPGLALLQLWLRFCHRDKTPKNEVELDRHRFLAPQRPVVVEHCDAVVDRHGI